MNEIIPVRIENASDEDVKEIRKVDETYSVPFDSLPVDIFTPDSLIRKSFAHYYQPSVTEGEQLSELLYHCAPPGFESRVHIKHRINVPIRVRIVLTYPLNDPWEYIATIRSDMFGEVFGIAYDMYKAIYDLDDAEWGQDGAPRLVPGMHNRARGEHVWGHDMSDLVFEYLQFTKHKDAIPIDESYNEKFPNEPMMLGKVMFSIGS